MGTKLHHAWVCDPDLGSEVGERVSAVLRSGSHEPLRAFWQQHAERRERALDAHRAPLDVARFTRARSQLEVLRTGTQGAEPSVRRLLEVLDATPVTPRVVFRRALDVLTEHAQQITHFVRWSETPPELVLDGALAATDAILSLDDGGLTERRMQRIPDAFVEPEYALAEACLGLARVPGWDQEHGLLDAWHALFVIDRYPGLFVPGPNLYDVPILRDADEPPPHLFERALERFGAYSVREGNAVLDEERWRVCGTLESFERPAGASGAELDEAITLLDERSGKVESFVPSPSDDDLDGLDSDDAVRDIALYRERAPIFRAALEGARAGGYLIVEWVEKE